MCSISGYYSIDGSFSKDDLLKMSGSMFHRGPDAQGEFLDEYCGLAHNRLSIIDLSARANQPLTDSSDRFLMIYNGEVYNFREIGAQIISLRRGHNFSFKSNSDTEVILEAFAELGVDFVHELNGMFAFAIYDKKDKELFLFRDRNGIKPLFFFWDDNRFAFASELKALLKIDSIDKKINYNVISSFLHLGFIAAPNTIYKNIYKLPPGHWIKVTRRGIEVQRYYNVLDKIKKNTIDDKDEALVKLSDLLISSVQYQLKSDVPFGVFLSGGIDSSLITAQAVQLSGTKVNTFSIGFYENSHNESEYARKVAKHLGTNHYDFIVSYKDAIQLIDDVLRYYDEPFADSSAIPTMLVSKLAKQYVTVTLSGEGGDELFFGYGAYRWANRLDNVFIKALKAPLFQTLKRMPSRYERASYLFQHVPDETTEQHIFSQEQYLFSQSELEENLLLDYKNCSPGNIQISSQSNVLFSNTIGSTSSRQNRKLKAMERQALFDLHWYLPDDLLTKVDRASMKYSVETRVPYLDHRVVEFALNLSPNLKYKNGISKYLLKQILYQYVPKEIFQRPKQGFAIPLNIWLKNELEYLLTDYLSETVVKKHQLIDFAYVELLIKRFRSGTDYLFNRLWVLIVLHKWFEDHT